MTESDQTSRMEQLRREGWSEFASAAFLNLVGPLWERKGEDGLQLGFLAEPRHLNRAGIVQGGMIATLADMALGVVAREADRSRPQATIELNVQFIDAGRLGEFLIGHGRLLRQTKQICFLSGHIEASGRLIANMTGIWKIQNR